MFGELVGETLLALWDRLCSRDIRIFLFFNCFSVCEQMHSSKPLYASRCFFLHRSQFAVDDSVYKLMK